MMLRAAAVYCKTVGGSDLGYTDSDRLGEKSPNLFHHVAIPL